jgi:hypothetical protein
LPLAVFSRTTHHREVVLSCANRVPLVSSGLAVFTVALLAGSASADPNPNSGRVPVTQPPDQVITGVCPFPIFIETLANKEYSKTHKNGVEVITGRLVVRITNTVTGESRVYNISGPVHITRDGPIETDVFGGRSLLLDPSFGVLVTSGRVVGTFNTETGEFRIVSQRGHAEDVCATLAA